MWRDASSWWACGPIGPLGALGATAFDNQPMEAAGDIRLGYAAITWGGKDDQAIADISAVGFKAIQLRSSTFAAYVTRPAVLKDLLARHGLTFAIHSSVDLKYQPGDRQAMLDLHLSHATFVRDAGGQLLQVIDELPTGRPVTQDDYRALAETLNALGERTKAVGVQLVYHNHMNSTGETPEALAAIMAATAADSVGLLFDIAHYTQGGGDPVKAIHRYGKAIAAVHLKDVRTIDAAPGYQWIELGRGRVDVKGSVAALQEVGFDGWAIVELDQVPDPGGSPRASAQANRDYVTKQLGLKL
jgi:inosose dehydratase